MVRINVVRYADGCQYVVYTRCLVRLLDTIDSWARDVGMQLNASKTEAAFWGKRRTDDTVWHLAQYGGDQDARGGCLGTDDFDDAQHRFAWLPPRQPIHVLRSAWSTDAMIVVEEERKHNTSRDILTLEPYLGILAHWDLSRYPRFKRASDTE